jgi:DNA-binding response OmpR family regulator
MGKGILYIEDDEHWRALVTEALAEAGFEVQTAQDGSSAMIASESANLNLIILDLRLPGESGIMLMKFLRRNHPDVPILLYTALDHDDATIQTMLDQGANSYLHKGSMQELLQAVGKMLSSEVAPPAA